VSALSAPCAPRLRSTCAGSKPGLAFLATTGSAAPFIGLFGTVWGIMNSFSAIAKSQDTSLSVVAPGIAEALFATAIGLVAAIPAVIAYNKLTSDLGRVQQSFGAGITALGDRLARDRKAQARAEAAE
jgi:biopolymer transport protein TolQ